MGIGCEVFLVDDDDSLQWIYPPYSGKRVRCAMVFVEVTRRQVLAIRNLDYFLLPFGDNGKINKKEWEKEMRLSMELLPLIPDGECPKQIIHT